MNANATTPLSTDPRLKMIQRVSKLMDEQFSIGGFRFGLDPLLNLIPIAGNIGSYIIAASLVITMLQYGASGKVVIKMLCNITLDALVGAIPLLGWIFDFTYKANTRNLKLLTEHYGEGKHTGSAKPIILSVMVTMVMVLAILIYLSVKAILWVDEKLSAIIFN